MAYRRGGRGGRGDLGRGGGSGEAPPYRPATGFVWPPPGMTPRPGPPPPQYPQPGPPAVVYRAPMLAPHQAAYQPVAAPVVYRAASPVPLGGYARSTTVTIRAPPPSHSPAPAPYQPAKAAAPAPSSCSSAPSAAALAKEVEQKLFVPAGEAAVTTDKYLAPVSKKGLAPPAWPGYGAAGKKVMIRANHFLVNVADNSLFHYDISKKQLDVAIGNLYRYHLPRVQRKLMVLFDSDQVKAKKLSPSGTNAMYSVHKVFGHTFIGEDYVPIVRAASKDVKEGKRPAEPPKKKLPESSSKKVKR